ncbi:MAG TPA: chromosome partition protein MukB [Kofleriaceae bacterium]|nr:chromosome partition protein MukB [Kofleriaceae bacterium]
MSRTRANALVLVNWKGVFYERYLLDRHVTALEGANGAGKTTVMIAAYVVLLPDMSRLRFTNLGETGATGGDKGIWGRLGEPGRPSYAALDFALTDSRRLIAGVHLERKGEPTVEPTPFIVAGLDEAVRLQDLMLVAQGESEVVPELTELRENAARLGGRLQVFTSARDYFAALFDQGVTPLRLGTDEERNKLNEMLRTSMTGGISRALTSELRSFLLKEEGGLADTLQRMKANLDACRRTRTEVQESQRLEREIGGVFEAGQTMFAAAFLATRERADELQRRVAEAEAQRDVATAALHEADAALARVVRDLMSAEAGRTDGEATLLRAKDGLTHLRAALVAAADVARCREELKAAETSEREAAQARATAEQAREARRGELRRAQENHKLAAAGLADLQRGLEQLHRRASAYRQVMRRRREAESLLVISELRTDKLAVHLGECRARLAEVDTERRDGAQRLADASSHQDEYEKALVALRTLADGELASDAVHAVALDALRTQRELRVLADRVPILLRELDAARTQAARQAVVRGRAETLGVEPGAGPASQRVRALFEEVEAEQRHHEDEERTARATLAEVERTLAEMNTRRRELSEREPLWQELDARARRLGEATSLEVLDRLTLHRARMLVSERLATTRAREEELTRTRERLHADARELLAAGGPFDPDLLRLKDQLAAELFAVSFEDAGIEEAGLLEARLGPLVQALVVEDPGAVARAIAGRSNNLSSVWLIARDTTATAPGSAEGLHYAGSPDVLVEEGRALRVSRIPERPRLGRKAREKRAAELRAEAELQGRELEDVRTRRRALERLVEDGEALLAGQAVWLAGDPAPQIGELRRQAIEKEAQLALHRSAEVRHAEATRLLRPRIDGLRGLLGDALFLDPPDHAAQMARLEEEHRRAIAAQTEVARCAGATRIVEDKLDVLRRPPLSESEFDQLRQRVGWLRQERDRLDMASDAIDHVSKNVEALAWSDAAEHLQQNEALVPALQEQLSQAEVAVEEAEHAALLAQSAHETATASWQDADGRRRAVLQQLMATEARFQALGIVDPTVGAVRDAEADLKRLEIEVQQLRQRLDELATERGRRESTCAQASDRKRDAEEKVASERREATPAIERWERLRGLASQHNLLVSVLAPGWSDVSGIRGHVNLVQEAHKQKAVLVERLRSARGGQALLSEVEKGTDTPDLAFADTYLELWLLVRDWLRRRLPAQVAEVDDPREALLRLRDQLASLEERLIRQENDLRGASEDVARGIDVQIRKARGQVNRLNKNLEGVSFGSIRGIRVRLMPVEKMEQVLRALREGAAQGLLFQEDLPIEEALDEIFRCYGGGRTGGQRLLDYREYVHLQVESRRGLGTDWEMANSTRLSTGEAIGVGAALMRVILTEWERDANLLRGRKSARSLRFLFLDEASASRTTISVFSSRSARPSTCSSSSRRPRSPTRRATRGRRTRTEA